MRAHTGIPGPIFEGNDLADRGTQLQFVFTASKLEQARRFHEQFHVNAQTLCLKFHIS